MERTRTRKHVHGNTHVHEQHRSQYVNEQKRNVGIQNYRDQIRGLHSSYGNIAVTMAVTYNERLQPAHDRESLAIRPLCHRTSCPGEAGGS